MLCVCYADLYFGVTSVEQCRFYSLFYAKKMQFRVVYGFFVDRLFTAANQAAGLPVCLRIGNQKSAAYLAGRLRISNLKSVYAATAATHAACVIRTLQYDERNGLGVTASSAIRRDVSNRPGGGLRFIRALFFLFQVRFPKIVGTRIETILHILLKLQLLKSIWVVSREEKPVQISVGSGIGGNVKKRERIEHP